MKIKKEMISRYTQNLIQELPYVATHILVINLCNKTKYVLYYQNLKYYLSLGMKLQKSTQGYSIQRKGVAKNLHRV